MKSISFEFSISKLKISLVLSATLLLLICAGFGLLKQPKVLTVSSIASTDNSALQKMKPIAVKATKSIAQEDSINLKNSIWFSTIQKEINRSEYFIREDASSGTLGSPNRKNKFRFKYNPYGFFVKTKATKFPLEAIKSII